MCCVRSQAAAPAGHEPPAGSGPGLAAAPGDQVQPPGAAPRDRRLPVPVIHSPVTGSRVHGETHLPGTMSGKAWFGATGLALRERASAAPLHVLAGRAW